MAKVGFVAVGQEIEFNGVRAVAVEDLAFSCEGCAFYHTPAYGCAECPAFANVTECGATARPDHKSIIFKRV